MNSRRNKQLDPQFRVLFNSIDTDGSGYLDKNEFEIFMRREYAKKDWDVSGSAIQDAFRLLDKNGDGTIDIYELHNYYNLLFS